MSNLITKLKINMMVKKELTFYFNIFFGLDVHIDNSITTACTNGKFIKFNEDFLNELDKDERLFIVLHECGHVALSHSVRCGNRDHKKFGAACDYAINLDLVDAGYTMPSGKNRGLLDEQYRDMSAEQIYDLLPDDDSYGDSDVIFIDPESAEGKELAQAMEEGLLRAEAATQLQDPSQSAGNTSADLKRILEKLLNPILPWRVILQNYMNDHCEDDYSMLYPDEEYMPHIYLPTLYSEGFGELIVFVDVSGSVGQNEVDIALAEIDSIKTNLNPKKLSVISFDVEIHTENIFDQGQPLYVNTINLAGGGGTELSHVAERIKTTSPKLVLIITDGYVETYPMNDIKNTDVIYLIMDNKDFTAPIGKVIHINTSEYK